VPRFPVYTDADVHGPIVDGLSDRGWSVVRAVDAKPEGTDDIDHFELAVSLVRVLIANDKHMKGDRRALDPGGMLVSRTRLVAAQGLPVMSNTEILEAIEELATKPDAFAYPIEFIKRTPQR
jgi:hypothetical protein